MSKELAWFLVHVGSKAPTMRGPDCTRTGNPSPAAFSLDTPVGSRGSRALCEGGKGLAAEKPVHTGSAHY